MKNILKKIDKIFCTYLGLESEVVSPNLIEIKAGDLFVSNTESFKRHTYTQHWDKFRKINLAQVSQDNKEKLGIAIGKSIAKNLIVSFENIQIKENK